MRSQPLCRLEGGGVSCSGVSVLGQGPQWIALELGEAAPVVFEHPHSVRVLCEGVSFSTFPWGSRLYTEWVLPPGRVRCAWVEGRVEELCEGVYSAGAEQAAEALDGASRRCLQALSAFLGGRPIFLVRGGAAAALSNAVEASADVCGSALSKLAELARRALGGAAECLAWAAREGLLSPEAVGEIARGRVEISCPSPGELRVKVLAPR